MSPLDWLAGFWGFLVGLLVPFTLEPRFASLFVIIVSTLFNLTSAGLNKLLIDINQQREYTRLNAEYRSLLKEAKLSGDKKLQAKLRKREAAMRTLGGKVAKQQIKMMVISMGLFWAFFSLVSEAFMMRPAALLPISLDPGSPYMALPFFYWYLLCSFAISRPLYRVIGGPVGLSLGPQATAPPK